MMEINRTNFKQRHVFNIVVDIWYSYSISTQPLRGIQLQYDRYMGTAILFESIAMRIR